MILASVACGADRSNRAVDGGDWSRFRGPNGSGIAGGEAPPSPLRPQQHERWRTVLPPGHSSPIVAAGRVFVTAVDEDALITYAIEARTGRVLWRRPAPRPRREHLDTRNDAAAPTPASDGRGVYVFFGDFGLLAYDVDGNDLWQLPLGPFDNAYGMGASPVLVDGLVVQVCDQKTGSFIIAVDASDGTVRWRSDRPGSSTGHSTPIVLRPDGGDPQLLVPGSFRLTAYSPRSGETLWWVSGLAFEMKATPVLSPDRRTVYVNGTSASAFEDSYDRAIPPFEDVAEHDTDGDGRFSRDEVPDELARRWFGLVDLDADGSLDQKEWNWYRSARASHGGVSAFRTGGTGDMTADSFMWRHDRAVPQLPSALLYEGVLYMIDDGGIATLLDPELGTLLARGRIPGAVESYYASPVAAGGRVYLLSNSCKLVVLRAGSRLDVLQVSDLDDVCYATPAIDAGTLYLRTRQALYAFAGTETAGNP